MHAFLSPSRLSQGKRFRLCTLIVTLRNFTKSDPELFYRRAKLYRAHLGPQDVKQAIQKIYAYYLHFVCKSEYCATTCEHSIFTKKRTHKIKMVVVISIELLSIERQRSVTTIM